jgi:hypothetical protein
MCLAAGNCLASASVQFCEATQSDFHNHAKGETLRTAMLTSHRSRMAVALMAAATLTLAPLAAQAEHGRGGFHGGGGRNGGYHGGGRGYHGGGGPGLVGGALLGLGIGAVVGGAIASSGGYAPPPAAYYPPPPPAYYAPPPVAYYPY